MGKKKNKYKINVPIEKAPPVPQKVIHHPISISFQFINEGNKYCLSLCSKDEVRAYLKALRMLTTMSWLDVTKTGGKPYGGKVGLGYTPYPELKMAGVSEDITVSGLRAGVRERFYGYHLGQVYFILAFDPKHELIPAS